MNDRGFTFVETVIVMGIVATLAGIATISVMSSQRRASLVEVTDILVSDIQTQQSKAMTGQAVSGVMPAGYGVYFESSRYTLFAGSSYNANDPANVIIPVLPPVTISDVDFGADTVIFLARSGEVAGYASGQDAVVLDNNNGQINTIQLNRYGVVRSMR